MIRFRHKSWLLFDLGARFYSWFTNQGAWRSACRSMARRLPESAAPLIADLGCGPGVSALELARMRSDAWIVGLDISPRMLDEARRRLRLAGQPAPRIALTLGDAARLPFRGGALDAVTGHSFLYLVANRQATLEEIRRVLRAGGRLILMEPNEQPARLRSVLGVSRDPRHLVSVALWRPFSRFHGRFTPDALIDTLESAGFVECRVEEVLGGLGLLASGQKPGA
jgi:ubiquinone/menaquinone biosynthesis C-methylase UbiE